MTWKLVSGDTVAVLGAGTMGAGIAHVAAAAGHPVLLFDAADGAVERARDTLRSRLERSVSRGRLSASDAESIHSRITDAGDLGSLGSARLVIEAIVEDLGIKQAVLSDVAAVVAHDAVIATNTSSLSVTAIAAGVPYSARVAGMHFFNPAPVMPLVEIVSGAETLPDVAAGLFDAAIAWGKQPVRTASTPGFIVNRVARPFYGEALRLLQEGVADAETIDAVITGAGGFRMGPFALMDLVGLDVNLAVTTSVYQQTAHDSRFAPNVLQQANVDAGRLGRKSGRGWFEYGDGAASGEGVTTLHGPSPVAVEAHGDLRWARPLVDRLRNGGVEVTDVAGGGPGHLIFDGIHLVPTDGATATRYAGSGVFGTGEIAVFDLVHDWSTATATAVAVADQASDNTRDAVGGLLTAANLAAITVDDSPGLVVMRIVAQLASVAADAVRLGVASPHDIDTAMRLGTNYPLGPLEWADALGPRLVVEALDHLQAAYGEDRYRAAFSLRRAALTGTQVSPPAEDLAPTT
jgi:3-hydroxybutyryl-CoA dehydrogenase